uniref:HAUS augmin-like complex, subunit 1 n=1 Tax=Cyprinus carpio TaxID=7962 RepID=A0A8C2KHG4_CYPCA
MLYTCAFPCIVLSSTPWLLFRPLNTAGKSLSVSTSLQSRWSSTPGTGKTPWLCGKPPGWPTSSPFRWKSSRCFSPSASFRLLKVSQWLRKVFGQQPVPEFEVNTRTVEILYELAESSETRCREAELLIKDHEQKTEEYGSDGTHLQEVLLQAVGLQAGGLSKPAVDLLSALEGTAEVLKLRDTSLGSYMPAINKLTNDALEAEKTDRRLQRELTAVRTKMTAAVVLRKKLQDDLMKITHTQQVEAATAEERLLNMDFMKNKSRDLACRNKIVQEKLDSRQMEDSLTHQAIVQLSEKITALKEESLPLKKKLEPYSDLSPSPALARVKIEEAKRELAALDAQLEQKVDFMNTLF